MLALGIVSVVISALSLANAATTTDASCSLGSIGACVTQLRVLEQAASSFCTSLLKPKTQSVSLTTTVTELHTEIVKTVTETSSTTVTLRKVTTTTTTDQQFSAVFLTKTVTSTYTTPIYTAAPPPLLGRRAPAENKISTDAHGGIAGFAASIVSSACSCIVTTPTVTVTVSKTHTTTTKLKTTSVVVIATSVPSSTKVKTISKTETDFFTTTLTSIVYKTKTKTGTVCDGADPTFKMQFHDISPTSTDQFNNLYATVSPASSVNTFFEFTSNANNASLFTLKPNGNLGSGLDGIAQADYFGPFENIYFLTKNDPVQFTPLQCSLAGNLLGCFAPPSPNFDIPGPNLTILQTCPEYVDFGLQPVIIGDMNPTDSPACFIFKFLITPICTPKK